MPWPTYSERFIATRAVATWVTWVVPDEMRAVVTCVSAVNATGTGAAVYVKVHGYFVVIRAFQAVEEALVSNVRIVAYQGETIGVYNNVPGIETTVSGFVFADLSGRDQPPQSDLEAASWPPPLLADRESATPR